VLEKSPHLGAVSCQNAGRREGAGRASKQFTTAGRRGRRGEAGRTCLGGSTRRPGRRTAASRAHACWPRAGAPLGGSGARLAARLTAPGPWHPPQQLPFSTVCASAVAPLAPSRALALSSRARPSPHAASFAFGQMARVLKPMTCPAVVVYGPYEDKTLT